MEKTITKAPKAQVAPAKPPVPAFDADREIGNLRRAIADMQSIATVSLEQIAAIGKLALIALETPLKTAAEREALAQGILAMIEKAQMAGDSVSYEAENVGVFYSDAARSRRAAAHHA